MPMRGWLIMVFEKINLLTEICYPRTQKNYPLFPMTKNLGLIFSPFAICHCRPRFFCNWFYPISFHYVPFHTIIYSFHVSIHVFLWFNVPESFLRLNFCISGYSVFLGKHIQMRIFFWLNCYVVISVIIIQFKA